MSVQLTVLCENSVTSPTGLIGEHGFACHLRTEQGNFLFDTGSGLGLENNARLLGIDLRQLTGVILSHGHADHSGGLTQLLRHSGPIDVYAHPDIFKPRLSCSAAEERQIGLPHTRTELEALGARFHLSRSPQQLAPGLILSGEIPRRTDFESGDPNLCCRSPQGVLHSDPIDDDLSLFVQTDRGLSVLLGCAHAGLINILDQAQALLSPDNIHCVAGGTHLMFADDARLRQTLHYLDRYQIDRFGAAHCTGLQQATRLAAHFQDRFFFAAAGTRITV
ncbi:MAG: MBL fold metallo-hydrolase [Desulfuromonas sp.]|nr:MAG: MBL fold metallo-hydrolase [Desulfuromonas sp.]